MAGRESTLSAMILSFAPSANLGAAPLVLALLAMLAYAVAALPARVQSRLPAPALAAAWLLHAVLLALDVGGWGRAESGARLGFGPVLSLIKYDTLEDAIAIANDNDYGLAGACYTTDIEKGIKVARKVRTGTFGVNTAQGMDFNGPFGGFKSSGVGRELGPEGIEAFCECKTISLPGGIDLPIGG